MHLNVFWVVKVKPISFEKKTDKGSQSRNY